MRGIYKITNTINGKSYIGKSENLAKRMKYHINSLHNGSNKNIHLQNAYTNYGAGTFTIEILEEIQDDTDIDEREKYWIEYYKTYDREHGYNLTKGGDGGNSYVECMADVEREEHYKRHKELRSGENNINYGKHLYTDGIIQRYISDEEIPEYVNNGWRPGANDAFRKGLSDRFSGENNPFYGKKHSKETIEKIKETKIKNGFDLTGTKIYHKDGEVKHINPEDEAKFIEDGWEPGFGREESRRKISETMTKNFQDDTWRQNHKENIYNHYVYQGMHFYGRKELLDYLRSNGYPDVNNNFASKIANGKPSQKYSELLNEIQLIKKRGE